MQNVVFFGDSICFGQGISPHKTWVTRISAEIDKKFPQTFSVINTSINGNTTRMALERMPFDVQSHGIFLMILQFGMNDCNYWASDRSLSRVSPTGFVANMTEIIQRAKVFGAKKIILNTNHPTPRNTAFSHISRTYEESNKAFSELIRTVASKDTDVVLNDIRQKWENAVSKNQTDLKELLQEDNLHLSELGHDLYFESTNQLVLDELTKLKNEV